jgi:hypothetical protein
LLLATGGQTLLLATGGQTLLLAAGGQTLLLATGGQTLLLATGTMHMLRSLPDRTCCAAFSFICFSLQVRIGGGVYPEIKEQDYIGEGGQYKILRTHHGGYKTDQCLTTPAALLLSIWFPLDCRCALVAVCTRR